MSGGRSRKADFADDVVAYCADHPHLVKVPDHFEDLLEFLWEGFAGTALAAGRGQPAGDDSAESDSDWP